MENDTSSQALKDAGRGVKQEHGEAGVATGSLMLTGPVIRLWTGNLAAQHQQNQFLIHVRRALPRAEPELPRSRLRGARGAQWTVGRRQRRSCRPDATAALVRRALLRAEPELPRSRLRGARGAQWTVGRRRRRSCRADATAALVIHLGYINKRNRKRSPRVLELITTES
ncbi:hypothetical protein NDU88_002211 [Pleurodeles waltl]|uniref:Uncharacterized protein n=1 Tax=Pleurodeles waltl TaxID=8319 RepID=A0AAV7WKK7_PLEWA|nr:hypothetical protein NDU88_002211 [Pleurodeles waltl]